MSEEDRIIIKITTIPQKILTEVYNNPGITTSEIREKLKLSNSTLAKAISILSDKYKLITKKISEDRKTYRLYPTLGFCDPNGRYAIIPSILKKEDGVHVLGFTVYFFDKNVRCSSCEEFISLLPEHEREAVRELLNYIKEIYEKLEKENIRKSSKVV